LAGRPATAQQQQEIMALEQNLRMLTDQMNKTSERLAEALKHPITGSRDRVIR
jgi:uncharacterized coiled-coil protein SlyX